MMRLLMQLILILSVFNYNAQNTDLRLSDFEDEFLWGAACASYQVEGAHNLDGKGPSIWDTFTHEKDNIKDGSSGDTAANFYFQYKEDILLAKEMNLDVFRFSISWSRIFPNGVDSINPKGVEFYHNVIDECLKLDIQPWITLYHWDLPQALENRGGWLNREILEWFGEYVTFCTKEYGSKVKNWMIMNEPAAFVGLGYMMGYHAPGKKGVNNFLKATHHACLAMADGGRIVRTNVDEANIGSTFSCSFVEAAEGKAKHAKAVSKINALLNRLYIEPSMGMGYPYDGFKALKRIEKNFEDGDEERLIFDFDFIGLQNYFPVTVKRSLFPPVVFAKQISAEDRDVEVNEMGFEINPEGIYKVLKQFAEYELIDNIIITENGVCVKDSVVNDRVHDQERIAFFESYLTQILKAKNDGVPVRGYFVWSLTDNFEWSEGYEPRFGLVHVNYDTGKRTMKDSGRWFKDQLLLRD